MMCGAHAIIELSGDADGVHDIMPIVSSVHGMLGTVSTSSFSSMADGGDEGAAVGSKSAHVHACATACTMATPDCAKNVLVTAGQ